MGSEESSQGESERVVKRLVVAGVRKRTERERVQCYGRAGEGGGRRESSGGIRREAEEIEILFCKEVKWKGGERQRERERWKKNDKRLE